MPKINEKQYNPSPIGRYFLISVNFSFKTLVKKHILPIERSIAVKENNIGSAVSKILRYGQKSLLLYIIRYIVNIFTLNINYG